jgi:hypothetical protein
MNTEISLCDKYKEDAHICMSFGRPVNGGEMGATYRQSENAQQTVFQKTAWWTYVQQWRILL